MSYTAYFMAPNWPTPAGGETAGNRLPANSLLAMADSKNTWDNLTGMGLIEPSERPLDISTFLDVVYERIESAINTPPRVAVSAPALNTVYGAELAAGGDRPRAFYKWKLDDGPSSWVELSGPELERFQDCGNVEAFRQAVVNLDGETVRPVPPSDAADQGLLALALEREVVFDLIDQGPRAGYTNRRQGSPQPEPAAPTMAEQEPAASFAPATPTPPVAAESSPPAPQQPELRELNLDQPFFISARRDPYARRGMDPYQQTSLIIAAGDHAAIWRGADGRFRADSLGDRSMESMVSATAAMQNGRWGSVSRNEEQQFAVAVGKRGMAIRRGENRFGTELQLFVPMGPPDPRTGTAPGEWRRFASDSPQAHQLGLIRFNEPQGMQRWHEVAQNVLASYEAGLPEIGPEGRQLFLETALYVPGSMQALREFTPEPRTSRPSQVISPVARRTAREQERRRQQPQGGGPQSFIVGWGDGGGFGPGQ